MGTRLWTSTGKVHNKIHDRVHGVGMLGRPTHVGARGLFRGLWTVDFHENARNLWTSTVKVHRKVHDQVHRDGRRLGFLHVDLTVDQDRGL